jgi:hypothetical protein
MDHKPSYYISIELPKHFDSDDADTIKQDIIDFIESKKHYGAKYHDKSKQGIVVNKIIISTNHD